MTYTRALQRGRFFCCIASLMLGLGAVSGCSSANPEIMQVEARIVLSAPGTFERLSLFVEGHDPDGIDDIAWMVVEYPDLLLGWRIEEETMVRFTDDGQHWFGSDNITLPQGATLPRSRLNVILGDLSGRTDTREITLPPLREAVTENSFPRLVFVRDALTVETAYPQDRHFIRTEEEHRELVFPSGDLEAEAGEMVFTVPGNMLSQLGDGPYWIIREQNSRLWLEAGPFMENQSNS